MTVTTIGQLIKKIMADYPEEVKEYAEGEDAFVEVMSQECLDLIKEHISLFSLSHNEARVLMDKNYGEYRWCNSKDEVKYNMLIDYVEYKLVEWKRFRSINSFKKYQLERSR